MNMDQSSAMFIGAMALVEKQLLELMEEALNGEGYVDDDLDD